MSLFYRLAYALLFSMVSASFVAHAGVILLIEPPLQIKQTLQQAQAVVATLIKDINALSSNRPTLVFEPNHYDFHISLAYLSWQKLPMNLFMDHARESIDGVKAIAQDMLALDLTKEFAQATVEFVESKRPMVLPNGSSLEHCYYVVLQLKEHHALEMLANALDKHFAAYDWYPKRDFPFMPHFTLGKLYNIYGQPLQSLLADIGELINSAVQPLINSGSFKYPVTSFTLRAHDGKEMIFNLAQP